MASKSILRLLVRQEYLSRGNIPVLNSAAGKSPLELLTAQRRGSSRRQHHLVVSKRAFSTSSRTLYAQVEESLDFRNQERESDQVDVCIVGGGNRPACSLTIDD